MKYIVLDNTLAYKDPLDGHVKYLQKGKIIPDELITPRQGLKTELTKTVIDYMLEIKRIGEVPEELVKDVLLENMQEKKRIAKETKKNKKK